MSEWKGKPVYWFRALYAMSLVAAYSFGLTDAKWPSTWVWLIIQFVILLVWVWIVELIVFIIARRVKEGFDDGLKDPYRDVGWGFLAEHEKRYPRVDNDGDGDCENELDGKLEGGRNGGSAGGKDD